MKVYRIFYVLSHIGTKNPAFNSPERIFRQDSLKSVDETAMKGKKDENWHENYRALHRYVAEHRHLPQKTVVEGRGMLNWWKYNKKCRKAGKLSEEQIRMLEELKGMISTEHTGGRKKKTDSRQLRLDIC